MARVDEPAESVRVAYDGKAGRTLRGLHAAFEPGVPQRLHDWLYTEASGATYSLFFHRTGDNRTLLDELDPTRRWPGISVTMTTEMLDNIGCIVVTARHVNGVSYKWWLDPARGHSMLRFQWLAPREGVEEVALEHRVTALSGPQDGIWYPSEGYRYSAAAPDRRMRYKARKVIVNDPAFPNSIFTIAFPKDAIVTDVARGRTYDPSAPSGFSAIGHAIARFFIGKNQAEIIMWLTAIGALGIFLALSFLRTRRSPGKSK